MAQTITSELAFLVAAFLTLLPLHSEGSAGPLEPTRLVQNGAETFIARPTQEVFAGALVLFHGCSHQGEDWFRLPEEVLFVRYALEHSLLVIAFTTPAHNGNFCWPTIGSAGEEASSTIRSAVAAVIAAEAPAAVKLPVLLAGGSSGGNFASLLPARWGGSGPEVRVVGVALFVSPTAFVKRGHLQSELLNFRAYPPVAFAYMPKDLSFASKQNILIASSALEQQAGVLSKSWEVHPKPLGVDVLLAGLHQAGEDISRLQAERFIDSLKEFGFLNDDGQVLDDPRQYPWRRSLKFLRRAGPVSGRDWLELSTEELLNRAWAQHEFAAEPTEEMLDWLLAAHSNSGNRDVAEL